MRYALLTLALVIAVMAAPDPPVSVTTNVHFATEPATFSVRVRIPPNSANRAVCVTYDAPEGVYRRSCWEIDNESPLVTFYWVRDLTAGEYELWADLIRVGNYARSNSVQVTILSRH